MRMNLLIKFQFVVVQGQVGENSVLGENVVADESLLEKIVLGQFLLLLVPGEEEEHLGLESVFLHVLIKMVWMNGLSSAPSKTRRAFSFLARISARLVFPTPIGPSIAMYLC